MTRYLCVLVASSFALGGCSVLEISRKNDERYLAAGAFDRPLSAVYSTYSFKLNGRYLISYDWVNTSACELRSSELPTANGQYRSNIQRMPAIYEAQGKTWQGSSFGLEPIDIDRWVRSVIEISRAKGSEGQTVEVGLRTLCRQGWAISSHFLMVRLRRSTLDAFQDEVTAASTGVPIHWTRRTLNGLEWRVLHVPLGQLRPRNLNAIGAPYQTWITALGDTGYAIAFSLGASKESLDHPHTHAALEATFRHLLHALRVEPLVPPDRVEAPAHK